MSALASRHLSATPSAGADPATLAGQLVDGLCHDCRTPLAIVAEFAGIVSEDLGPDAPSEVLDFLWSIGERVREVESLLADYALVDRLLRRPPPGRLDPVDVGVLLAEKQSAIGPLARAFGKQVAWSGLDPGLRVSIRGGELVRAVGVLIDNLYRIPGDAIAMRLRGAGPGEVGGPVVIECTTGDVVPDSASWSPATAEQMSFRHQLSAAIAAHYGGRLDLMDGAEHRACRLVLRAAEPGDLPAAA
jgi:hypothetical protein